MAAKTGNNFICGTLTDSVEIPAPNSGFSTISSSTEHYSQMIATTIDYQKLHRGQLIPAGRGRKPLICRWNCHPICHSSGYISISGFEGHIAISGCRPLSQSLGDTIRPRHSRKFRTCCWKFHATCCSSGGITTSGFGAISLFPVVVGHCRNHLASMHK